MKLDIGSGPYPATGFTSVDAYAEADIKAEMWDIPLESGTVAAVRSVHSLEHVSKHEVMPALREWFRLLQSGGTVLVEVPDLAWCVTKWVENPTDGFELDRIFGLQTHAGEMHRIGFTHDSLGRYLWSAGFIDVTTNDVWSHEQQSIEAVARKP